MCAQPSALHPANTGLQNNPHNTNHLVKFADDTTLVGLISHGEETHYRTEVDSLARWCSDNNLLLNIIKSKEIMVNFQRGHRQHLLLWRE